MNKLYDSTATAVANRTNNSHTPSYKLGFVFFSVLNNSISNLAKYSFNAGDGPSKLSSFFFQSWNTSPHIILHGLQDFLFQCLGDYSFSLPFTPTLGVGLIIRELQNLDLPILFAYVSLFLIKVFIPP